ncbi:hypothetical protein TRM7615_04851 [Falsiruegeria mediterranea M17]|uniref:Uncharacterized protein n=1 Tax=Falsiruegeria mediterranea M17 TaxID=1200281 RepID=A0A2R8CGC6_9RHOB|nr:hypothetical protein TRM7615_04851 [Falsiruegeria mediterranea M17]
MIARDHLTLSAALDAVVAQAGHDGSGRGIPRQGVCARVAKDGVCPAGRNRGCAGGVGNGAAHRVAGTAKAGCRIGADGGVGAIGHGQEIRGDGAGQGDHRIGNPITVRVDGQNGIATGIADRDMTIVKPAPCHGDGVAFGGRIRDREIGNRIAVQIGRLIDEQINPGATGQGIASLAATQAVIISAAIQAVIVCPARKGVLSGLATQRVVVAATDQVVIIDAALKQVIARPATEGVIAALSSQGIATGIARNIIIAVAAQDQVMILPPIKLVGLGAARQGVIARSAIQLVRAGITAQRVIARIPVQDIVPLIADQRIIVGPAAQRVRACLRDHGIRAGPAIGKIPCACADINRVFARAAIDAV